MENGKFRNGRHLVLFFKGVVIVVERRRSKRTELKSRIIVKRLDSGKTEEVGIDVLNVSKTGIGFTCVELLEIGAVYEAYLTIWTKEVLHAFIEVVRIEKEPETYQYGGMFIGMPEIDLQRIDVYQVVSEPESYIKK